MMVYDGRYVVEDTWTWWLWISIFRTVENQMSFRSIVGSVSSGAVSIGCAFMIECVALVGVIKSYVRSKFGCVFL